MPSADPVSSLLGLIDTYIAFWPPIAALLVVGALAIQVGSKLGDYEWLNSTKGQVNYDFSKSWGSTLTLVGALVGTMLSAGVLTESKDKAEFASLNAVFLMLTLVAPLFYSAFARRGADGAEGTMLTLLIASALTLWAVFGQLATMALVIDKLTHAELPPQQQLPPDLRNLFLVLVLLAVGLMVIYAWRSLYALAIPPPKKLDAQDQAPDPRQQPSVTKEPWALL